MDLFKLRQEIVNNVIYVCFFPIYTSWTLFLHIILLGSVYLGNYLPSFWQIITYKYLYHMRFKHLSFQNLYFKHIFVTSKKLLILGLETQIIFFSKYKPGNPNNNKKSQLFQKKLNIRIGNLWPSVFSRFFMIQHLRHQPNWSDVLWRNMM